MLIETEFNLNDRVWFMKDNKPVEAFISAIHVFRVGTNQDHIKYNAKDIEHSVSWLDHENLFERSLFKSKIELFDSL